MLSGCLTYVTVLLGVAFGTLLSFWDSPQHIWREGIILNVTEFSAFWRALAAEQITVFSLPPPCCTTPVLVHLGRCCRQTHSKRFLLLSITALKRSKISRALRVKSRGRSHNSSPFVSANQRKKWDFWRAVSATTRKEARCVSWGGVIVTSSLALGIADKIFISPWHKQHCGPGYRHKLHFYVVPLKGGGQGLKCYFRKSYSATFTAYLGFLSSSTS